MEVGVLPAPTSAARGDEVMGPAVAVMQPYAFPYLGYFNLVHAGSVFVFYDDVNYIPRGWINRNRILIDGAPWTFTIPVAGASQNRRIRDIGLHDFEGFRTRFLRQLRQAYGKAPCFAAGMAYVEDVLRPGTTTIAELAIASVQRFCERIGLDRRWLRSSEAFAATREFGRAQRLAAITQQQCCARYVNAEGGQAIYSKEEFAALGLRLDFVKPRLAAYPQYRAPAFIAGLSVIDVMMNCPPEQALALVADYELV